MSVRPHSLWYYLSEDHGLGLVLSFHNSGRLLALHRRLAALHDDEGPGDVSDTLDQALAKNGLELVKVSHRPWLQSEPRRVLHLSGSGRMAGG